MRKVVMKKCVPAATLASLFAATLALVPAASLAQNNDAKSMLKAMSDYVGSQKTIELAFDSDYGSLTTPPCTEGVRWLVLKNTTSVSKKQAQEFHGVMHHDNNRPVQKVNARPVLK